MVYNFDNSIVIAIKYSAGLIKYIKKKLQILNNYEYTIIFLNIFYSKYIM